MAVRCCTHERRPPAGIALVHKRRYEIAAAMLNRLALPHMHIVRSLAINKLLRLDNIVTQCSDVKKGVRHAKTEKKKFLGPQNGIAAVSKIFELGALCGEGGKQRHRQEEDAGVDVLDDW